MALIYNRRRGRDIKPLKVDLSGKSFQDLDESDIKTLDDSDVVDNTVDQDNEEPGDSDSKYTDEEIRAAADDIKELDNEGDFDGKGNIKMSVLKTFLKSNTGKDHKITAEDRDRALAE